MRAGHPPVNQVLNAIALLTVAVAALELAQTIIEEEVQREAHMAAPTRVRRFLSRFMIVLVVALSIETLVAVFEFSRADPALLPYAASIGIAAAAMLAAWGVFIKLNRAAEELEPEAMREGQAGGRQGRDAVGKGQVAVARRAFRRRYRATESRRAMACAISRFERCRRIGLDREVVQQSVVQPIDEPVQRQRLAAQPRFLHDRRAGDVDDLLDDVELAQAVDAPAEIRDPVQPGPMLGGDVLHVPQPVVDEAVRRVLERRPDAAAAVMADDDDVLDLQDVDGVLEHREAVEVGMHDDIRDVPVDEQLAWRQVDDLVRRHAAVGAPDPQVARRLLGGELREEPGRRASTPAAQARLRSRRWRSEGMREPRVTRAHDNQSGQATARIIDQRRSRGRGAGVFCWRERRPCASRPKSSWTSRTC